MAITLFRHGNSNLIDGVECEARLFPVKYGRSFIGIDGWCESIEDLKKKDDKLSVKGHSSKDIRALAKEAGIDGWEKKRISTLKEVLSGEGE